MRDEGVGVSGIGLGIECFRGFRRCECLFAGDGDAGPVGAGRSRCRGRRKDETAVSKVPDAHVYAYEGAVGLVFSFFLLALVAAGAIFGSSSGSESGLREFIKEASREEGFGAAAVDAGGVGDALELGELAGGEPGESGGHPWWDLGFNQKKACRLRSSLESCYNCLANSLI